MQKLSPLLSHVIFTANLTDSFFQHKNIHRHLTKLVHNEKCKWNASSAKMPQWPLTSPFTAKQNTELLQHPMARDKSEAPMQSAVPKAASITTSRKWQPLMWQTLLANYDLAVKHSVDIQNHLNTIVLLIQCCWGNRNYGWNPGNVQSASVGGWGEGVSLQSADSLLQKTGITSQYTNPKRGIWLVHLNNGATHLPVKSR